MTVTSVNETINDVDIQPLSAQMHDAYGVYITTSLAATLAAEFYTISKWVRFDKLGAYQIQMAANSSAEMYLNNELKVTASGAEITPLNIEVTEPIVYRMDIRYRVTADGDKGFVLYSILAPDGSVKDVSRGNELVGGMYDNDTEFVPEDALGQRPFIIDDERFNYPVWLLEPNWVNAISEGLLWLTDVITTETGAEQRRRLRVKPRRTIEASFLRSDLRSQIMLNTMAAVGKGRMLLPVWFDGARTTEDIEAGTTATVYADTEYKDFQVGDIAMLWRGSEFDYELIYVVEAGINGVRSATAIQGDTPAGSLLIPLISVEMRDKVSGTMLTDSVSTFRLRFYQVDSYQHLATYDYPPLVGPDVYSETGLQIFSDRFNWRSSPETSFDSNTFMLDNNVGIPQITDVSGQRYGSVRESFHLDSPEAELAFMRVLYYMQGRYKTFHLPSWRDDFELEGDIDASQGALLVERCGYTQYNCASQSILKYILIEKVDGTKLYTSIVSSRVINGVEWLYLSATVGNHPRESIRRICYMPIARLDADSIEIERLTNTKSRVTLPFKIFDDRRQVNVV